MTVQPRERSVSVNGHECRVREAGEGRPLIVLGGLIGVPHWTPFLSALAAQRRVIVPSLPGFPGATGHDQLDSWLDWIAAALDLLDATGLHASDLLGSSLGGSFAAEIAGLARESVQRLVLIAPLGMHVDEDPVGDPWAMHPRDASLLTADPAALAALLARPDGIDAVEWPIVLARANEAAARILWPTCDLGIARRLHRITAPTLLLWGSQDRFVPPSYAERFAERISGPVKQGRIDGAGHLAELDAPEACARAVLEFLAT